MHFRSPFRHVRRPTTCRAAVTWGWLGALLLLGLLLLLGSWGEQPGGERRDGVRALPPVGAVVLRHSSASGTFAGRGGASAPRTDSYFVVCWCISFHRIFGEAPEAITSQEAGGNVHGFSSPGGPGWSVWSVRTASRKKSFPRVSERKPKNRGRARCRACQNAPRKKPKKKRKNGGGSGGPNGITGDSWAAQQRSGEQEAKRKRQELALEQKEAELAKWEKAVEAMAAHAIDAVNVALFQQEQQRREEPQRRPIISFEHRDRRLLRRPRSGQLRQRQGQPLRRSGCDLWRGRRRRLCSLQQQLLLLLRRPVSRSRRECPARLGHRPR